MTVSEMSLALLAECKPMVLAVVWDSSSLCWASMKCDWKLLQFSWWFGRMSHDCRSWVKSPDFWTKNFPMFTCCIFVAGILAA